MKLTTDDRVWRFQGRLIELDGKEIYFHPRYVTVALFIVCLPFVMVPCWLLFPPMVAVGTGAFYAGLCASVLANHVTGEFPVTAWWKLLLTAHAGRRRGRRERLPGPRRSRLVYQPKPGIGKFTGRKTHAEK